MIMKASEIRKLYAAVRAASYNSLAEAIKAVWPDAFAKDQVLHKRVTLTLCQPYSGGPIDVAVYVDGTFVGFVVKAMLATGPVGGVEIAGKKVYMEPYGRGSEPGFQLYEIQE